jgi:hypothetical protein
MSFGDPPAPYNGPKPVKDTSEKRCMECDQPIELVNNPFGQRTYDGRIDRLGRGTCSKCVQKGKK